MKDIVYWIWYALRCGASSSDGVRLLEYFPRSEGGDCPAKQIYEAGRDELLALGKFDHSFISRFADHDLSRAEDIIEFCFMNGIRIVSCDSEYYPRRLHSLYNKPIVLYCRGKIENLNERLCVGVVGTRSMTNYGKHAAFEITRKLCSYNTVIISGAASGIDSVANYTALYFESDTIAVLGTGVNVAYPAENKGLIDRIAECGLVISEFAPNTPPSRASFPIRNRIISGLSDALLVVEGGEKSGALITARCAADQGRPVYAVPGNIDAPESRGTNLLIRDGAILCTCGEDIVRDFAGQMNIQPNKELINSEKYIHYEMRANNLRNLKSADYARPVRMIDTNAALGRKSTSKPDLDARAKRQNTALQGNAADPALQNNTSTPPASQNITDNPPVLQNKTGTPQQNQRVGTSAPAGDAAANKNPSKPDSARANPDMNTQASPVRDTPKKPAQCDRFDRSRLNETQRRVYDSMPDDGSAVSPDKLTRDDLPASEVLASLTILELYSAVESLPGGLYRRLN